VFDVAEVFPNDAVESVRISSEEDQQNHQQGDGAGRHDLGDSLESSKAHSHNADEQSEQAVVSSGSPDQAIPDILEEDQPIPREPKTFYQFVPECRTCYELFREWEELTAHLNASPGAQEDVQREGIQRDRRGSSAWLQTVQMLGVRDGFEHRVEYLTHRAVLRHERQGIVPRYQADNKRWHQWWKGMKGPRLDKP